MKLIIIWGFWIWLIGKISTKKLKKHLSKQLSTVALEEYIYLGKPNLVEKLLNAKPNLNTEKTEYENSVDKESLIGNVINRIKNN